MDALISLSVIIMPALFIVWVIGVVLALSRWRRHPRVSLFALLAFAIMLVSSFLRVAFPPIMREYDWLTDQTRPIFFRRCRAIWRIDQRRRMGVRYLRDLRLARPAPKRNLDSPGAADFRQ